MKYIVQPVNHNDSEMEFNDELDAISYALTKPYRLKDIRCPILSDGKTYFYWQTLEGLVGYKIISHYTTEDVYAIISDGQCDDYDTVNSRFDNLQDKWMLQLAQLLNRMIPPVKVEVEDQDSFWVDKEGNRYDSYIEGMLEQVLKLVKERF